MIFKNIKYKIKKSLISTFESREYGRNNEVVVWRGSTMLLLKLIICQVSLYPKIIHVHFVVMRLASGRHARPYEMGLSFIKRENKTCFWAFALHDLVE